MVCFARTSTGSIKIGATNDLEARLIALAQHYGEQLVLLATRNGDREEERRIHAMFSHLRFGRTEQFRPGCDLMEFIGLQSISIANPDEVKAKDPAKRNHRADCMKLVNFMMPEQMYDKLMKLSKIDGVSLSKHIRNAASEYLNELCT